MKKLLIIAVIFIISCGSRKNQTEIATEKAKVESITTASVEKNIEQKTESKTDLATFFEQYQFSVASDGQPYRFKFGELEYQGSATVSFEKKTEKKEQKTYTLQNITYQSQLTYKTKTNYVTKTRYKTKETQSSRPMWWLYVLLYLVGLATVPLIKLL